jgi:hypothetical protein
VLVMYSLFCPLPCLRGVLEFAPSVSNVLVILSHYGQTRALHEDMEVDKIMRTLLTLGANSSTPRRHGSGQNNENITTLVLVMFSLFCPLPCLRGVFELAPNVRNVLIILSIPCLRGGHGSGQNNENITNTRCNSSTPRRDGSGQNNENITNTRGKLEHSTKTWKWTT